MKKSLISINYFAEGVENEKQVELLANPNCHKFQGFYYSEPIPVDELEKLFL
ncbi:EAL domain-containing protein [Bacillus sp. ISL-40]|nr:EAL domain-containing protein [Bacillus sp. ISL-40]MBT2741402.1 EAL domain-containing protein [Bacillus sp. ISL-77]